MEQEDVKEALQAVRPEPDLAEEATLGCYAVVGAAPYEA